MNVAVIKYNAGNVKSLEFALNRLGIEPILTMDKKEIMSADKVIFPGVGEASTTMSYLRDANLHNIIPEIKSPFLGICLGMQLMCESSEEGDAECLNIFPGRVKRFPAKVGKVPHMGWNTIKTQDRSLLNRLADEHFYFVHSYYVPLSENTIGTCDYGIEFSAVIKKNNFYAVQFHPEKSGKSGEQLLKNFLEL